MRKAAGIGDQPDDLVELVAARDELLTRAAERPVDSIPRQRHVLGPRALTELELEQPLPPLTVPVLGRVVEQEQVPPVVRRVARGANHQVPVATFDDVVDGQYVVVGCPHQGSRNCLCAHDSYLPTRNTDRCGRT